MAAAPLRLALCQGRSPAGRADRALARVGQVLSTARDGGARMLVMPELFLPGYNSARLPDLAQPADGPWAATLSDMCRKAGCGLTIGFAERDGERLFNAALAFGPDGKRLAHYRKIQLFGDREQRLFTPGDRYVTFPFAGRKAALLICYDIEFPEHVRALALQGVQLILVPTANMEPYAHICDFTIPSHATIHGLTIAYANLCGREGDLDYCGRSVIAGPDGQILAQAGRGPAVLFADLPAPADPRRAPHLVDYRPVVGS
jgi:5-aminopentanamidase